MVVSQIERVRSLEKQQDGVDMKRCFKINEKMATEQEKKEGNIKETVLEVEASSESSSVKVSGEEDIGDTESVYS
ncbi:hypothetical protein ACOSQ4_014005 [Xanthoceras sorbifolium]